MPSRPSFAHKAKVSSAFAQKLRRDRLPVAHRLVAPERRARRRTVQMATDDADKIGSLPLKMKLNRA